MLDLAINHTNQLQAKFRETIFKEKYKYYFRTPTINYFIPITDNSDKVQFASLNEYGEVIGYLSARINRLTKTGFDVEAIHFGNKQSLIFTQDMFGFYYYLYYQLGLNRVVWSVIEGNPAEQFFDSLIKYGARIVGTFTDDAMLYDGELYNLKYYEWLKKDFQEKMIDKGYRADTYRQDLKGGDG